MRAIISWSGGKDSCLALIRARDSGLDVSAMVTMFDETGTRSRSHGLRPEIVRAQAQRLSLPSTVGRASWHTYTDAFAEMLAPLVADGFEAIVFGDIFEDSHREWNEKMAARAGLRAVQPLWGEPTDALTREFVARGGLATIVTIRADRLDKSWLGRTLTSAAVDELGAAGVDPAGEYGEYHTVVTACPLFRQPLTLSVGDAVERSGCWALDVTVEPGAEDC